MCHRNIFNNEVTVTWLKTAVLCCSGTGKNNDTSDATAFITGFFGVLQKMANQMLCISGDMFLLLLSNCLVLFLKSYFLSEKLSSLLSKYFQYPLKLTALWSKKNVNKRLSLCSCIAAYAAFKNWTCNGYKNFLHYQSNAILHHYIDCVWYYSTFHKHTNNPQVKDKAASIQCLFNICLVETRPMGMHSNIQLVI